LGRFINLFRAHISKMLRNYGYEIRKYPDWKYPVLPVFDILVTQLLKDHKQVRFIQIGGNDGIYVDPIRKFYQVDPRWTGHIYEPNPQIYSKLKYNLLQFDNRILSHQIAVSNSSGLSHIFVQDPESRPHASEISSMNKKAFLKQKNYGAKFSEIAIKTETLTNILENFGWKHFEILQIDTEGHECEIIVGLDLQKFKPLIMQIEVGHLKREQINKLTRTIANAGYDIYWGGHESDMVCLFSNYTKLSS
jgi:FkbM family methyltransferase